MMMVWTRFMDMHSGGGRKLDFELLFIEAPADEARAVFFNRFGRNPDRVTCTCCGPDYSIGQEGTSLDEATEFDRRVNWNDEERWTLERFIAAERTPNGEPVMFIKADEIGQDERNADIPEEGYVWR